MNPVFVALVLLAAVIAWVLLAFSFRGIGALAARLGNDVKKAISEEEKEKDNEDD